MQNFVCKNKISSKSLQEQSLQESSTSEPPDEIEYIKAVVRCCSMKDKELASFQER